MIIIELISKVMGLSLEGVFIHYKSKGHYQKDMEQFLKDGEKVNRL